MNKLLAVTLLVLMGCACGYSDPQDNHSIEGATVVIQRYGEYDRKLDVVVVELNGVKSYWLQNRSSGPPVLIPSDNAVNAGAKDD